MAENTYHKKLLLLAGVSILASTSLLSGSTGYAASCSCNGTQSRSVTCLDHKGDTTSDVYCQDSRVGPRPPSSQSCTATCYYYSGGGGGGGGGDGDGGGTDTDGDGLGDNGTGPGVSVTSTGFSVGQMGSGGGGGGGGGGSVLCGHYFARGLLDENIYIGDQLFDKYKATSEARRGYHAWGVPVARHLNNNPGGIVEKALKPIVLGWATEMAYKMKCSDKGSLIGKALIVAGYPLCHALGYFVKDSDYSKLQSEQLIKMINPLHGYQKTSMADTPFLQVWEKTQPHHKLLVGSF